jgi:hypothetical protein
LISSSVPPWKSSALVSAVADITACHDENVGPRQKEYVRNIHRRNVNCSPFLLVCVRRLSTDVSHTPRSCPSKAPPFHAAIEMAKYTLT